MKQYIRTISTCLLLFLLLAFCAACSKEAPAVTTTTNGATLSPSDAKNMPQTIEDIVSYYNTTANATKAAKSLTLHEYREGVQINMGTITLDSSGKEIGSATMKLVNKAVELASPKPESNTYQFENGAADGKDIKNTLPSIGKQEMSLIAAADLVSATCEQDDAYYRIILTLKPESLKLTSTDMPDTTHAKGMECIDPDDMIGDQAMGLSVSSVDLLYENSTIEALIDPQSGILVSLKTSLKFTGSLMGKAPVVGNITGQLNDTTLNFEYEFRNVVL